jgi:hypothetical protein
MLEGQWDIHTVDTKTYVRDSNTQRGNSQNFHGLVQTMGTYCRMGLADAVNRFNI